MTGFHYFFTGSLLLCVQPMQLFSIVVAVALATFCHAQDPAPSWLVYATTVCPRGETVTKFSGKWQVGPTPPSSFTYSGLHTCVHQDERAWASTWRNRRAPKKSTRYWRLKIPNPPGQSVRTTPVLQRRGIFES